MKTLSLLFRRPAAPIVIRPRTTKFMVRPMLLVLASWLAAVPAMAAVVAASYTTGTEVPVTATSYTATGSTVNFTLNYAPAVGTQLMVVNNTGLGFISGTFSNLAQGQTVALSYGGVNYSFVANYYGGTGNDLVLVWKTNRASAWGYNPEGELGNNTTSDSSVPVAVTSTGLLAGKTVVSVSAGGTHSLALCSDGTVAAWGRNAIGQLGNGSTTDSHVPVAVTSTGVLAGKMVVAVSAGQNHSLALCSDGTVAAWGYNSNGGLGNNSTTDSFVPVAVSTASGISALFGKTVVAVAAGGTHSLALCSDGTVVAWGQNFYGQLGNNSTTTVSPYGVLVPVAVTSTGGLLGKTVVAVAAGEKHSLALCSDGTVAAWGYNLHGRLGNNSTTDSSVPVAVTSTGVLAGRTVVAVAAAQAHSLALCADGTVAAWGYNYDGELGNNSTTTVSPFGVLVPVRVTNTGVLAGKTVVAVATGGSHCLALCSDGTMTAWGYNPQGQLGNNSTTDSPVPVAVSTASLATGERFTGIGAHFHTLALVATPQTPDIAVARGSALTDGVGSADFGSVAPGSSTPPKTFTITNPGGQDLGSLAIIKDGANAGDFSVSALSSTTVAPGGNATFTVTFSPSASGACSAAIHIASNVSGAKNPFDIALTGTGNTWTISASAGANGSISPTGNVLLNDAANQAFTITPATGYHVADVLVDGVSAGAVTSYTFTNVTVGHTIVASFAINTYRVAASAGANGTISPTGNASVNYAANQAFTITPATGYHVADVLVDGVSAGAASSYTFTNVTAPHTIAASFAINTYTVVASTGANGSVSPAGNVSVNYAANQSFAITPATGYHVAGVLVDGVSAGAVTSYTFTNVTAPHTIAASFAINTYTVAASAGANGSISPAGNVGVNYAANQAFAITPTAGYHVADVLVDSVSAGAVGSYTFTNVTAAHMIAASFAMDNVSATYTTGTEVPLSVNGLSLAGNTVNFTLNYAPAVGTQLIVVNNTGLGFISGTFSNLAQGQTVALSYGGLNYYFVANYYGGTGNDLVLVWKTSRVFAWGWNPWGQLGNNSTTQSPVPVAVAVTSTGVLAGKTVVAVAASHTHSVALCADGAVAVWGHNSNGELGNNSTADSLVPVAVTSSGVLAGKTVVAVAAGENHSLALCSDGTVTAWGLNSNGQLGNNSTADSLVPVAVTSTGVLAGKKVVAVAAGSAHSLALCSDGTVTAWGYNVYGQLGNNSRAQSPVPVAVSTASDVSALFGKTVVAVSAGLYHSLALCSDGTVAAWGYNGGRLGNNSWTDSPVPVAVSTASGISSLFGKTVVAVAAGGTHSLALCSDGTVTAWGDNYYGQLGNNATTSNVPVPMTSTGGLAGKTVVAVAAGVWHNVALCSDGTVATWGRAIEGQLGNNSTTPSTGPPYGIFVPAAVTSTGGLATGELFTGIGGGNSNLHTLALVATPQAPDFVIAQGSALTNGVGSVNFGAVNGGSSSAPKTFTITNSGNTDLGSLAITKDGANAVDFSVSALSSTTVAPGGNATFTVTFRPSSSGSRNAAIHIASNVAGTKNPFDIAITGVGDTPVLTNDTFNSRVNLGNSPTVDVSGNNTGAMMETGESTFGGIGGASVWYQWTAPTTGWVTVHTAGSPGNTVLGLFTGTTLTGLTELGHNDDSFRDADFYLGSDSSGPSRLVFYAQAGTSYQIVVQGYVDGYFQLPAETGDFQLHIAPEPAPPFRVTRVDFDFSYVGAILDVTSGPVRVIEEISVASDTPLAATGPLFSVQLLPPDASNNGPWVSFSSAQRNFGDASAGRYRGAESSGTTALVPQYALPGQWSMRIECSLNGEDYRWTSPGNDLVDDNYILSTGTATTLTVYNSGNVDRAPPTLVSVREIPILDVNVENGAVTFNLELDITDSLSGYSLGYVSAKSASTGDTLGYKFIDPYYDRTSGSLQSATYRVPITIPAGTNNGTYYIAIELQDVAGNRSDYTDNPAGEPRGTRIPTAFSTAATFHVTGGANVPGIAVELPAGTNIGGPEVAIVPIGSAGVGQSTTRTFTVRNSGTANLTGLVLAPDIAPNSGDFAIGALGATTLAPGAATNFTVTFTPTALGFRRGGLRIDSNITSNDGNWNPFFVLIAGTGTASLTPNEAWRQTFFGSTVNSGNAADTFDYDHDGLSNLIEWACNLNPTTASTLPATAVRSGANFEFTYTRSVTALNAGTAFTVEWSDTLAADSWSTTSVTEIILSDNGTVQQVKATLPAGSAGHRFAHLKVTAPP